MEFVQGGTAECLLGIGTDPPGAAGGPDEPGGRAELGVVEIGENIVARRDTGGAIALAAMTISVLPPVDPGSDRAAEGAGNGLLVEGEHAADGLLAAAEAGATAVIQPGGSMRDDEVIKAADDAGLAMVMTGFRHFRH